MSDLEVDFRALKAAEDSWDSAADQLDGAWRRLHGTTATASPDVASAFEAFRETWVDETKRSASTAQRHAESLGDASASYETIDAAAVERLHAILPWDLRQASLDPDGGPPPQPSPTPQTGPAPTGPAPTGPAPTGSKPDPAPSTPSPSPGPSPTPSPTSGPTP